MPQKILHIATIDIGGSYKAAKRLNELLCKSGFDSKILVRTKANDDSFVSEAFENDFARFVSKAKNAFNLLMKKGEVKRDILGCDLRNNSLVKEADIIIIHWVSTFLSPKQIYELSLLDKKVFFVMHDMWLFTGGCHVDRRCGGYTEECIKCPMAGRYAHKSFAWKKYYINKAPLHITGPSKWIVDEAGKSNILRGKTPVYMPNVYNSEVFHKPNNREIIRRDLGLENDTKVILLGAADSGMKNRNKGFDYLVEALKMIKSENVVLAVMGNMDESIKSIAGFPVYRFGYVQDENKLARIYAAADVFVNPSLQESFGYTVCEAMACGTPCVAFAVGGMLDQIDSKNNGYLAEFCDTEDFAFGIDYVLNNRPELSNKAVVSALRFSYDEAKNNILNIIFN